MRCRAPTCCLNPRWCRNLFAVQGWPYYLIIDKAGIVRERDRGYALSGHALRDLEVEQLVTALLAESTDASSERIIPRISQIRSEFYIFKRAEGEKRSLNMENSSPFSIKNGNKRVEAAALINRAYDRMVEARHFSGPGPDLSRYRAGLGQFSFGGELGHIFFQQFDRKKWIEAYGQVHKQRVYHKQPLEKVSTAAFDHQSTTPPNPTSQQQREFRASFVKRTVFSLFGGAIWTSL